MADTRVRIEPGEPLTRRRLVVLFRAPLVIPALVVLSVWSLVAAPLVASAWFALLVGGKLPAWLHRFLAGLLRYEGHVSAWLGLLSARYPDPRRSEAHPFRIELPDRGSQRRLLTLFRLPLALPALVLASALNVVLALASAAAWLVGLALGRTTSGLQELGVFCLRYQLETQAYVTLLTASYPRLAIDVTTARE